MQGERKRRACATARAVLLALASSLALVPLPRALAQAPPWASCPDGSPVETATAFGPPHLAGYGGGNLTPELLQAVAFVALTRPEQRGTVEPVVTARLRANGVQFDQTDWATLINGATSGVDNNATARGLLYGLITGPLNDLARTEVPGILRRRASGALFARGVVELDTRECVLWPTVDKLIKSPCQMTAGDALYLAARDKPDRAACVGLSDLQMNESPGLLVAVHDAKLGATLRFEVLRSATATLDQNAQQVWSGEATVKQAPQGEYAILARDAPLAVDPSRPFLVVDTIPPAEKTASCQQPLKNAGAAQSNLEAAQDGLHGPYASAIDAVEHDAAGLLALRDTGSESAEWGFVIVRDQRGQGGSYYTTPPVRSSQIKFVPGRAPLVLPEDYDKSFETAFQTSCERWPDFRPFAATVHTHPWPSDRDAPDNFSAPDFDGAIEQKIRFPPFEAIFMINARDRVVRMFTPKTTDKRFSWLEGQAFPKSDPLWQADAAPSRTEDICTYPESLAGPCVNSKK